MLFPLVKEEPEGPACKGEAPLQRRGATRGGPQVQGLGAGSLLPAGGSTYRTRETGAEGAARTGWKWGEGEAVGRRVRGSRRALRGAGRLGAERMGAESRVGRVWSGKGREGEGKVSAWVAGGWGRDEGWGTVGAGSWWGLWGGVRLGRAGSRVAPPPVAGKAEQTGPRRRREGAGLRAMAASGALLVMGVSGSGK